MTTTPFCDEKKTWCMEGREKGKREGMQEERPRLYGVFQMPKTENWFFHSDYQNCWMFLWNYLLLLLNVVSIMFCNEVVSGATRQWYQLNASRRKRIIDEKPTKRQNMVYSKPHLWLYCVAESSRKESLPRLEVNKNIQNTFIWVHSVVCKKWQTVSRLEARTKWKVYC